MLFGSKLYEIKQKAIKKVDEKYAPVETNEDNDEEDEYANRQLKEMEKKAFIEQYESKKETKKGLDEMNKYLKLAKTKSDEKI